MGDRDDPRHGRCLAQNLGDTVNAGEEIVDIETDESVNSSEARSTGTLARLLAEVGKELPVGHLTGVTTREAENDEAMMPS